MSVFRFKTSTTLAWALALATGLALLAGPQPATAGTPKKSSPAVPRLDWQPCDEGFECATAKVPLDYDHPHSTKISLSLIRIPASDRAHRLGSVFINPGGPGGPGVEFVREVGSFIFSDEVRARFDIVGFDPRGIIESSPLQCFDTIDEAFEAFSTPFAFPVTKQEEQIWAAADRKVAGACAERHPAILDHMSTADAARDMDLLRQAVHDKRLTYAGYSYGTYLGATYANLFPGKVRALVVDGVLDPVAWATGRHGQAKTLPFSTRLRSDAGAMATLHQLLKLCDRGGDNCAFSQGDPELRYQRLAKRLLRDPAEIPDGEGGSFTYLYSDLIAETLGSLYDPASWPDLAMWLNDLDQLTSTPSKARASSAATSLRALRSKLGLEEEPYLNFVEGFPGVACSDTDNPSRLSAWSKAGAESDRRFGYFGRTWTWVSSICLPWPGKAPDRYTGPFTQHTSNSVLVVGNRYDPATRYQGAVTLAGLLPDSRLLTLDGWGHTSLFASACIDENVSRYLLTGRVPPKGTVCEPDVVPFADSPALLKSQTSATRSILIPAAIRRMISR